MVEIRQIEIKDGSESVLNGEHYTIQCEICKQFYRFTGLSYGRLHRSLINKSTISDLNLKNQKFLKDRVCPSCQGEKMNLTNNEKIKKLINDFRYGKNYEKYGLTKSDRDNLLTSIFGSLFNKGVSLTEAVTSADGMELSVILSFTVTLETEEVKLILSNYKNGEMILKDYEFV